MQVEEIKIREQFGAVPYRQLDDGGLSVMLVTTRETRRWMVPKGNPIKKLSAWETAATEAFEEAGVKGAVADQPVGSFEYKKRLTSGRNVICRVHLFPLLVTEELDGWPEMEERTRSWFAPATAAEAVDVEGLARILLAMGSDSST